MNSFETTAEVHLRSRNDRRRRMVSSIRGWLRHDRHPRLTIIGLLALSAALATTVGYALATWGVSGWGTRAFWAVVIAWPAFVALMRWRAAVEWQRLAHQAEPVDHFIAIDELAEREMADSAWNPHTDAGDRRTYSELGKSSGEVMGSHLPATLVLGALTLGAWLIWDLAPRYWPRRSWTPRSCPRAWTSSRLSRIWIGALRPLG